MIDAVRLRCPAARTGAPRQLTIFAAERIFSFDFSRGGKQLALSRGTRASDVIVITGFR